MALVLRSMWQWMFAGTEGVHVGLSSTTWFAIAVAVLLIGVLLAIWDRGSRRRAEAESNENGNQSHLARFGVSEAHADAEPAPIRKRRGPTAFLCHSSGDKERVRELYRSLTADGIICWFDEEDLLPGQDWEYEIAKAVRSSRFVLACLSSRSTTTAGYVHTELKKAIDIADEQPEGVAFLIPVRLEECQMPNRLQRWHWVDLYSRGGYERLLRILQEGQAAWWY